MKDRTDGPDDLDLDPFDPPPEATEGVTRLLGAAVAEAMRTERMDAVRTVVAEGLRRILPPPDPARNEPAFRALVTTLTRVFWNASPLPSAGYRPRPVPAPQRNDACPCGSGQKHKRCCLPYERDFAETTAEFGATVPEGVAWAAAAGHWDEHELDRLLSDPALPADSLEPLGERLRDLGHPARALELVRAAVARGGDEDGLEAAVKLVIEIDVELHGLREAADHVRETGGRRSPGLRAAMWRQLAAEALGAEGPDAAREFLALARAEEPDDARNAVFELMISLYVNDLAGAQAIARKAVGDVRTRRQLREETHGKALELLRLASRDPAAARELFAAGPDEEEEDDEDEGEDDDFVPVLAPLAEEGCARAVRPYRLETWDDHVAFGEPPRGVKGVERRWRLAFPGVKPALVDLFADQPDDVYADAVEWLGVLADPAAFDSIDILDDLVLALSDIGGDADEEEGEAIREGGERRAEEWLVALLLDRAEAIVRASLDAHPGRTVPWAVLANRPALRLLSHAALRLFVIGQADEAAERFEWILALNPNDNHGHRTWLVNHHLVHDRPARALEIADVYPGDVFLETTLGRALALWRLERHDDAMVAMRAAARDRPKAVRALLAGSMRRPAVGARGIAIGGDEEAWLYREAMGQEWGRTPEAVAALREVSGSGKKKAGRKPAR